MSRETQEQLEKVEKNISAFHGHALDDYNVRRGLESLKSHIDIKVNKLLCYFVAMLNEMSDHFKMDITAIFCVMM